MLLLSVSNCNNGLLFGMLFVFYASLISPIKIAIE